MTIEINEDTPFAADITAASGPTGDADRYRLIVEGDGVVRIYREMEDGFGQRFWRQGSVQFYTKQVADIIVALAKQGAVTA